MTNSLILVGRLAREIEVKEKEGKEYAEIVLSIPRNVKNEEGIYETDFIPVAIWGGIASNVKEYCRKGDIIGVRGRIEVVEDKIVVIAEKVTFLSSKKSEE